MSGSSGKKKLYVEKEEREKKSHGSIRTLML